MWQAAGMSSATSYETCDFCGFDAEEWNDQDAVKTVGLAGELARLWTADVSERIATERSVRPTPADEWSILEFATHLGDTAERMHRVITAALDGAAIQPGDASQAPPAGGGLVLALDESIAELGNNCTALAATLSKLAADQWAATANDGMHAHEVRSLSRHVVHDLLHHLIEIAEIRAAAGDGLRPQEGAVVQLSSSGGGVPKNAVESAVVGRRGIVGDTQKARVHHGRPWQALCLWSSDVIDALVAEGDGLFPGAAGENITVNGINWSSLRGGTILEIGEVRCQLSAPAMPCSKISQWFAARDSSRIDHGKHPGWSRWYASVLQPGTISTGDAVRIIS